LVYFLGLGVFLFIPLLFLNAQTAQDIQTKIDQSNANIISLEKEMVVYQSQLDTLGKQKNSLSGSISELDINRKKLIANIAVTQNKIDNTNLQISGLTSQIGNKENIISNDKEAITIGFRNINESEMNNDTLFAILSGSNFSSVWNDINDMNTLREKVRSKITELKQVKSNLEDTRTTTTDARNKLMTLKIQLADQKKIVEQNKSEKDKLLSQTKDSEANYQKLLQNQLSKKNSLEKEVSDYESQLKYILDPSKLPSGSVLSWPLESIYITSPFGPRTGGFHNGVDFRASVGTPVKAMADGVVAGTGDTDLQCTYNGRGVSFGRFVLIKYNNGLASTYGHLSLIKVIKGQQVSRGEIVAYSGNTGYSTGPHLHVSVYARDAVDVKSLPSKTCPGQILTQPISPTNAYLDPMIYLPLNNKP
jgi:murein DD-endopeptidase MepM/ murein hydrolase activator NlpD